MDKEKILSMSREEYEYGDLVEKAACEKGIIKTHWLLFYVCMALFVLDFLFGHRINLGFILITTLDNVVKFKNKSMVSKKKIDAIFYRLLVAAAVIDVIVIVSFYYLEMRG